MAIISEIGRKSTRVRLLYIGIYALLILGAITMIYPFLLMISGSTKSAVDIKYFDVIPNFIYDDVWLYRKHIEGLFNERAANMNQAYFTDITSFEKIDPPALANQPLADEFKEFIEQTSESLNTYTFGYLDTPNSKTMPLNLRRFKGWLSAKYGNDINVVNNALETEFLSWNSIVIRPERYLLRREKPILTPYKQAINEFQTGVAFGLRYYFSLEGFYIKDFLKNEYSMDIAKYNQEHNTSYSDYKEISLPKKYPEEADQTTRKDWEYLVRSMIGTQFLKVDKSAVNIYRKYLEAKHQTIANLNKNYDTSYKSFDDIPIVEKPTFLNLAGTEWAAFIEGWRDDETGKVYKVPIKAITISCIDFDFMDFMEKKFKNIDVFNEKFSTSYKTFTDIKMPQRELHYAYFNNNKFAIKKEFVIRNYIAVADYLLFHGRGVFNTVVYCLLAIVSALIINPLAAYAMSRYKLPTTYIILLFLLCTMAFPPMVTQIPNFLMLRQFGLLNTFAALILPGMANGYAIFLLKGFFDSQPQELYESASLDGASEWVIFWQITMSLSKPILAVIALQAFNMAYSNFMFAFVVCQDEKMWTLMVWLYQLQQRSGQAVMYASLIIAAIPTFLIFLFCQNIIMRGIVVPSEK